MVLDAQGKDIMRLRLDYTIYPLVADDGKFLCFTHNKSGNYPSEPYDPCQEALSIYDLSENRQVYYREFANYQQVGFLDPSQVNREIICLVSSVFRINPETIYEVVIVEASSRQVKTYSFTPSEAGKYIMIKSFKNQKEYLAQKKFTTTKF